MSAPVTEEELPEETPVFEETPDFLSEFGLEPELDGFLEEETDMVGFMEEPEEIEPVTETAVPDVSAEALGTSAGVDLSDPNAALSPEDIAKLFAAAGN